MGERKGWQKVKYNVKKKKFTESLRQSDLMLHDMDECAPGRHSGSKDGARRKSVAIIGESLLLNKLTTITSGEDLITGDHFTK